VTGGSRGIGRAIAKALLDAGARVAITGRAADALTDAETALAAGDRLLTVQMDVGKDADVTKAVAQTVERFGGLDILINNAGIGVFTTIAEMTTEQWASVIETNLTGVFYCCRAAIPELKRRGGGYIINVSSLAGKNWFVNGGAYCASKAGLNAFTDILMQEVRYDNIKVTNVAPGSVYTGFANNPIAGEDWKLHGEDIAQTVLDLLAQHPRSLPSVVEMRPSRPKKK